MSLRLAKRSLTSEDSKGYGTRTSPALLKLNSDGIATNGAIGRY